MHCILSLSRLLVKPRLHTRRKYSMDMGNGSSSNKIPDWLQLFHNHEHISAVLQALMTREDIRDNARTSSRIKTNPAMARRNMRRLVVQSEHVDHYSIAVGCDPANQVGNRYADIEPYDRTRVIVESEAEQGRYLNASWVRELAGGKWWIATQAPLPHTSHAFLSLIIQSVTRPPPTLHPNPSPGDGTKSSCIRTVVQLTRNLECGKRKAHVYFPPSPGESWTLTPEPGASSPPLKVTLIETKNIDDALCVQSSVSVHTLSPDTQQEVGGPIIFQHLLFTSWPDQSVPVEADRNALLNFIRLVERTNRDLSSQPRDLELDPDPPVMVNCSAGVGRTGAFIALSSLLRAYNLFDPSTLPLQTPSLAPPLPSSPLGPLAKELQDDMVALEVDALREQRPGMVQRDDQVLLIYDVLLAAFSARQ